MRLGSEKHDTRTHLHVLDFDAWVVGKEDFATTCSDTRRLMYVLTVHAVTDTQLVHAGSSEGAKLIAKAWWSGFGR